MIDSVVSHDDAQWLLELKIHSLTQGIQLTTAAEHALTHGGTKVLTVHEYATTGGITVRVGDVYINAPFDEWFCQRSEAVLDVNARGPMVHFRGVSRECGVLPLPGYLESRNSRGELATSTTMTHCDRIRVSPISGCVLDCKFCDVPGDRYQRHSPAEILDSIAVAKADKNLVPKHLLISGGSPGPKHFEWFEDMVVEVTRGCGLPTDVMMAPREGSLNFVDRFVAAGVKGFSLNLEVFGAESALAIMPRKHLTSTPFFEATARRAVDLLGFGTGAVRSIVIVGLDDLPTTLAAVEHIARLGADPVLSPFRPARGTQLSSWEPPSEAFLHEVYAASQDIAARHGVVLGPRCIPCQHNTLTLPVGDAYFSYGVEVS